MPFLKITKYTIGLLLALTPASNQPDKNILQSKEPAPYRLEKKPKPVYICKTQKSLEVTFDPNSVDDTTLLTTMIYGEARSCSKIEQIAIAHTAINRQKSRKNETPLKQIILAPNQYSFFNKTNEKIITLELDEYEVTKRIWEKCYDVAQGVLSGRYKDPLEGGTHYVNPQLASPSWRYELKEIKIPKTELIHKFYKKPKKTNSKSS